MSVSGQLARRASAIFAAVGLAAAAFTPAPAGASDNQESLFQDDTLLVYAPDASHVASTLNDLAALGVDRIRVSVFWKLIAPSPNSATRPANFKADDPNAYPPGNWTRYDELVRLATARGLGVDFNVTSPAPLWATNHANSGDVKNNYQPDPREYGLFLKALGTRYSGSFTPATTAPANPVTPPQPTDPQGITLPGVSVPSSTPLASTPATPNLAPTPAPPNRGAKARATGAPLDPANASAVADQPGPLPRINYWSLWNEPNQPGWLTPQWGRYGSRHKPYEVSPVIYRSLVDWAALGLAFSGHLNYSDTILIGETAPKGAETKGAFAPITPLRFIRRLYCLDDSFHPLRGALAVATGCPTSNAVAQFPRNHPELFGATGFADHPYTLLTAPHIVDLDPDWAALGELPRLARTLDRAQAVYRHRRAGGMPIYLTEYGYQTNPPDPYSGLPPWQQAAYLDEAEYMSSINSRVRVMSQFLLRDDRPLVGATPGTPAYWSTFQTGLEYADGSPKPSLNSYRLPIYIPFTTTKLHRTTTVWGQLRAAPHNVTQIVQVQFAPGHSNAFGALATRRTASPRGFFRAHVHLPGSGLARLAWADAAGNTYYSDAVYVKVIR